MAVGRISSSLRAHLDGWSTPRPQTAAKPAAEPADVPPERPDALAVSLSDEGRAALQSDPDGSFAEALEASLGELAREAEKALVRLGLSEGEAQQASRALLDSVRRVTGSFAFELDVAALEHRPPARRDGQGFSYRAALVVDHAVIAWDGETSRFGVTGERVALAADIDSGRLLVTAAHEPSSRRGAAAIRLDAAIPVRERANGAGHPADPVQIEAPRELRLLA